MTSPDADIERLRILGTRHSWYPHVEAQAAAVARLEARLEAAEGLLERAQVMTGAKYREDIKAWLASTEGEGA